MKRLLLLRYLWTAPPIFWAAVVGLSFHYHQATIERQIFEQSRTQGRDIFRMVRAMRLWNSGHGGVYVTESATSSPSPYLDKAQRELQTRSGNRLVLVTAAQMVREMAEAINQEAGIRIHTSSLRPINPANAPDPWEREALEHFANGKSERAELVSSGKGQELRYMAPLIMQSVCLSCHVNQAYRLGDVRGGISVSFSTNPILATVAQQKRELIAIHVLAWVALSLLGIFTLTEFRVLMQRLERARSEQEGLVEKRTAELQQEVRERRRAESSLHYLVDSSAHGMLGVDRSGRVTFCNRYARELLEGILGDREIIGTAILEVLTATPEFSRDLESALAGNQVSGRISMRHRVTGREHHLEYAINAILDHAEVTGCVISLTDITVRQQEEDVMWRQAHFDPLTSLPNRIMFTQRMTEVLCPGSPLAKAAVLFVDLDDFKPVNDQYGHKAGDTVLMEIAHRLQQQVRESDLAARLGGDEFVVVLGGVGELEQVARITEKILESLRQPIPFDAEHKAKISASIGISLYPRDGSDIDTLLRHADAAMYHAKMQKKGSYGFYQPGLEFPAKTQDT